MQPDSTSPTPGRVAFRYGWIIGLILAVVETIILIIVTHSSAANLSSSGDINNTLSLGRSAGPIVLNLIGFVLGLVAYFVAGILAARRTGRVSTGVFAGMWAGGFYGAIDCIIAIILFFTVTFGPAMDLYSRIYHSPAQLNSLHTVLIASTLIGSLIGVALAIGWGAGLGALGGLIGRSSWRKQHPPQPYPSLFYPGQPYPPPMQQYPPAQSYPAQQPWPYQPGYPPPGNAYPPARPDQSPPRWKNAGSAGDGEQRTPLDRSYRPVEPANQELPGTVPQPRPDPSGFSEPENPYSN